MNAEFASMTALFDRVFQQNVANGYGDGPDARIVEKSGGFELQQQTAMMNGTPEWTKVMWSRRRNHCVEAAALRSLSL